MKKKYIGEIYLGSLLVITLLFWKLNYMVGLLFFSVAVFVLLVILNNIKGTIPILFSMLFLPSTYLQQDTNYTIIIIAGALLIVSLATYLIKNKCVPKRGFFLISYIMLAISAFISYFFSPMLSNPVALVTFASILYLIIYLFFSSTIKENIIPWLCSVSLYIGLLLTGELLIATICDFESWRTFKNILLGWGVCNDAAIIIMCVAPLGFYQFIRGEETKDKILTLVKLLIMCGGIIISNCRGAFLFGLPMFGVLGIYSIVKMKAARKTKAIIITCCISAIVLCAIVLLIEGSLVNIVIDKWKKEGLNSAGRFELYKEAWNLFLDKPIFGNSMLTRFDWENRYIVYHSTFFEALAAFGIIGVLCTIYFFFKKYRFLFKNKGLLSTILIISFIFIDVYSMIDNTYIILSFCIYLGILLPALEKGIEEENNILIYPNEIQQEMAI